MTDEIRILETSQAMGRQSRLSLSVGLIAGMVCLAARS